MNNEKLYVYHEVNQKEQAETLHANIISVGLEVTVINLDSDNSDKELVHGMIEKSENPFPILRIGDQKIRAMLQNPTLELLQKMFSTENSDKIALPQATIYSTTWCGDCQQLKMWMDSQKIAYKEIDIEDSEELKEQVTNWSGGRRVVPTVEYESIGRLFNPGVAVFQKLHK